uniref:Uncharacterized protein n=1 Tax=Mola mola TaxID=94237 RepID=A0A3Q3WXJ1_MOLML
MYIKKIKHRELNDSINVLFLLNKRSLCSVVSRYTVTTVESSVWNQLPITKEAAFEVDLPSSAFISNFTITSNGKVYMAQVKERAAARKIYDAAKKQGKTAGLVATKSREIEKFRVAVSVPSGTQMLFSLTYEELLPRRLGRYELSLGLRPGQLVQNLTVDVSITERTGISFIRVLPLKTNRLLSNTAQACCARVHYSPTLQQQNSISSKGLNADFIIQYDVDLRDLLGEVQVYDGYFVHYFAPRGLPVVPKDVIFVIDVSGSMIGTKIKQTKQAMSTILEDLREGDHFNIITFSDKVHTWKKGRTVRATRQNVRDAKDFVKRIIAEGCESIIAFLTPGPLFFVCCLPSVLMFPPFLYQGPISINAKKALGSASLFGLAFGDDADFLLLKRLALDNRGVARMVYEDTDAALQLKGFYDEVASPLLSDIQLSYLDDQAFDITRSLFPNYFQGSELVVTGKVKPGVKDLKVSMSAIDSKKEVKFENDVLASHIKGNGRISSFVHRLWAYFTIKELLLAKLNTTDPATQRLLADKATNLSLKYNFVTPFTSLVVVKPDECNPELIACFQTMMPPMTTTMISTMMPVSSEFDGDPHFVVQLPKLHHNLCFTVDGRANDVLRLLSPPPQGIIVDGHLMGAPPKHGVEERSRTYFDLLTVSSDTGGSGDIMITLSLDAVVVEGEGRDTLPVNQQGSVRRQGVTVSVDNHRSCWIQLAKDVQFLVLFHQYKHPSYLQMAHLGFYITDGRGLSASTQGLLGKAT